MATIQVWTQADLDVLIGNHGTPQTPISIRKWVTTMDAVEIDGVIVDGNTFGQAWPLKLFAGLREAKDITLHGFYDDTATTGIDALLNENATTVTMRGFQVVWRGVGAMSPLSTTWNTLASGVGVFISKYKRMPKLRAVTEWEAVLSISGVPTEAAYSA